MKKGLSAWLVTWEWSGAHAEPKKKVAEILNPRLSTERVREIVEVLYNHDASLSEKVAWRLLKRHQPYRAEYPTIEGVPWRGQIICGHNPWLLARLVDDLSINTGVGGEELVTWTDRYTAREVGTEDSSTAQVRSYTVESCDKGH